MPGTVVRYLSLDMKLVAVLPTYNESANLEACVSAVLSLRIEGMSMAACIVDDDSPDGTGAIADRLAAGSNGRVRVLHRRGVRGLGSAYLAGFAAALDSGADFVAQLDADLSHDPNDLVTFARRITTADLVIGSRYVPGGSVDHAWSLYRRVLSDAANRGVIRHTLDLPVCDATSGFRLWRAEALRRLDFARQVSSSGYGFQVEMCLLAHRLGMRIVEVPIHFSERGRGRSKMTLPVKLAAIRDIFALRWRHRDLAPAVGNDGIRKASRGEHP